MGSNTTDTRVMAAASTVDDFLAQAFAILRTELGECPLLDGIEAAVGDLRERCQTLDSALDRIADSVSIASRLALPPSCVVALD